MAGNAKQKIRAGFTLIEVLFAIIFVGLAIVSLVGSNIAFSQANSAAVDLSTAEYLAEQLRELVAMKSYDEIIASFASGCDFDPPIDASGSTMSGFEGFVQQIKAENVNPADLSDADYEGYSPFLRVTVRILKNGQEISSSSWIRAHY